MTCNSCLAIQSLPCFILGWLRLQAERRSVFNYVREECAIAYCRSIARLQPATDVTAADGSNDSIVVTSNKTAVSVRDFEFSMKSQYEQKLRRCEMELHNVCQCAVRKFGLVKISSKSTQFRVDCINAG